ncbi:hypothetical protein J1N35_037176 [Gossypium stocksii]|uniref:Uncharacterized protein n=1 Tax=Gossypium stocksii TaxID=47602 RepID=A0A9D3UJJ6_9ROSI|nr:hypothetical protein J1N35_037176 [Gossypium stocksii]
MAKVTTGFQHVTITLKFKRCKLSAVRDFSPGCGRRTTVDFGLHRQITVDQGKYSLSICKFLELNQCTRREQASNAPRWQFEEQYYAYGRRLLEIW